MTYYTMAKSNTAHSKSRKFSLKDFIMGFVGDKRILGVFIVVVLGLTYILQINQLAVLGYDLKKIEKESTTLHKEVMQLKIDSERMKSAVNLQDKTKYLNMVQSQKINYIFVSEGELALGNSTNY